MKFRGLIAVVFLVLVAPLVVMAATGLLPWVADDYWQICALQDSSYPGGPDAQNLFRFSSGGESNIQAMNDGSRAWWTDPDLRVVFWRPLSTVSHRLDYALFGTHATGAKVHSALWYALLVWLVGRLFRRVVDDERARVVGLLAFVVCGAHWQIVAWIAARNAAITAALGVGALLCHLRWRQDGWRPGMLLAPAIFAAGLAGGEAALGILGYLVAVELVGVAKPDEPLPRRLLAAAPMLVVGFVWLGMYVTQGFGTAASGGYLDPIHEPLVFLPELPVRLLAMHGMQYLGFPPDLWFLRPDVRLAAVLFGAGALLCLIPLARVVWPSLETSQRRVLGAFALGSLLAMVPQSAGFLGARSLTLPSVGASVVLGLLLVYAWRALSDTSIATLRRRVCWGLVALLVGANFVAAPLSWFGSAALYIPVVELTARVARGLELPNEDDTVVVLTAPDPFLERYLAFERRVAGLPTPKRWFTLSIAPHAHEVTRIAPNAFELRVIDGEWLASPMESLMRRADRPMPVGHEVELDSMTVRVLEVGEFGPKRARFTFPTDLPASHIRFFAWIDGTIAPFDLPAVGQSVVLPWVPGPTAL